MMGYHSMLASLTEFGLAASKSMRTWQGQLKNRAIDHFGMKLSIEYRRLQQICVVARVGGDIRDLKKKDHLIDVVCRTQLCRNEWTAIIHQKCASSFLTFLVRSQFAWSQENYSVFNISISKSLQAICANDDCRLVSHLHKLKMVSIVLLAIFGAEQKPCAQSIFWKCVLCFMTKMTWFSIKFISDKIARIPLRLRQATHAYTHTCTLSARCFNQPLNPNRYK